jgi:uncharacterized protein YqeY
MSLLDEVNKAIAEAMKAKDRVRLDATRMLKTALVNRAVEKGRPLDEAEAGQVVAQLIKQRRDSIEEYRKGNRPDLVEREEAELEILQTYQPEQLTDDEIRRLVVASIGRTGAQGMGDMGKVMRDVMAEVKGRADGNRVNAIARDILVSANG